MIATEKISSKSSMTTSTIIHPLFEECKNYTLDPYWKDKFSNFAHNRFPVGVRYDPAHRNLILKLDGKKTEVVALPEDDAAYSFQIVMKILRERLDMHSNRDLKTRKEKMVTDSHALRCDLDCEWKKIKPRHLKDQLMMDYIAGLKQKYNLTPPEVKHLISVVQLGFQFRAFSQDDVNFSKGVVKNIEGLKFDSKTRKFMIPEYPSSKTSDKASTADKFYSNLKKFLKDDAIRSSKFR